MQLGICDSQTGQAVLRVEGCRMSAGNDEAEVRLELFSSEGSRPSFKMVKERGGILPGHVRLEAYRDWRPLGKPDVEIIIRQTGPVIRVRKDGQVREKDLYDLLGDPPPPPPPPPCP